MPQGLPPSAESLLRALRDAERPPAPPALDEDARAWRRPHWGRITGASPGGYLYSTQEVTRAPDTGTWVDVPDGVILIEEAREQNDALDVPTSTIVRLWPDTSDFGQGWTFLAPSAGSGSGIGSTIYHSGQGATFEAGSFLEIMLGAVLKVLGSLNIQPGALIHWPYFDHVDVITAVCLERAGDGSISNIITETKRIPLPPFLKAPFSLGCHEVGAFGCCDTSGSGSGSGSALAIACVPCVADCGKCVDTGAPSCWTFTTSAFSGAKFQFNGTFTLQYASGCTWDFSSDDVQWTLSWAEDSEQWLLSGVDPVSGEQRVYYVLGPLAFECLAENTLLIANDFTAGSGDVEDAITLSPVANDCFTGPAVDVPCCTAAVPQTLVGTFTSDCVDVNGVSTTFTYGGLDGDGNHYWTSGNISIIADSTLTLTCRHDLGDVWQITGITNGCVSDEFVMETADCASTDAVSLVFLGHEGGPPCPTCVGAFAVTLTITTP